MKKTGIGLTNFFLIGVISLLAYGCSHDNVVVLQGSYHLPKEAKMEAIRMFTVDGEVKDVKIINDFVNKPILKPGFDENSDSEINLATVFWRSNSAMPIDADAYCNVIFAVDKATIDARLGQFSTFGKTVDADVIRIDPIIIVSASAGTEYLEKPANATDYFEINEITKVKSMIKSQKPISVTGFWESQMRYNSPFIIEKNEVSVPILIYIRWYNDMPRFQEFKMSTVYNLANEDFLKKLSANDTILIQEGKAVLQRR